MMKRDRETEKRPKAGHGRARARLVPVRRQSLSVLLMFMLIATSFAIIHITDDAEAQAMPPATPIAAGWDGTPFVPKDMAWNESGEHAIIVGSDISKMTNAWHLDSGGTWAPISLGTYYVGSGPGNHTTFIQDAVNIAGPRDTVYVWPGTYSENVLVDRAINLIGHDRDTTIIDGSFTDHVVRVTSNWVNISSFAIQDSGASSYGLLIDNADNCRVQNCKMTNNQYGIYLSFSNNCIISSNQVTGNSNTGIYATDSTNNLIEKNDATGNTGSGIVTNWANSNTLRGNIANSNGNFGINLFSSSGNIVYNNNIMGNSAAQGNDNTGANTWYQALPVGGNHWSDWTGPDANVDGIVDSPKTIAGFTPAAQDNYPWVLQDGWLQTFGSGTVGSPYIIRNVTGLQAMQNSLNAFYALGNDIDAS
ncbi:MAG: NosD domain-containing protein, partial [Thermoplasmata archaeon]